MTPVFEPRSVGADAWKAWLRQAAKLFGRVWWVALPMTILVGLVGGWLLDEHFVWLFVFLFPFALMWETTLVALADRAANGKPSSLGEVWGDVAEFWVRAPWSDRGGLKYRFILLAAVGLVMLVVVGAVVALFQWWLSTTGVTPKPSEPPSLLTTLSNWSSWWGVVFLWGWALHKNLMISCLNPLVRKVGVSWELGEKLWEKGIERNFLSLRLLSFGCLGLSIFLMIVPGASLLFFPLEIFWACLVMVIYRDVFEHKTALEKQEATSAASQASPSLV